MAPGYEPLSTATLAVINPATEKPITSIAMGNAADAARAIAAARAAFPSFSQTSKAAPTGVLKKILALYNERGEEIAQVVSDEMGAPLQFARDAQVWAGRAHLESTIAALEAFEFEQQRGSDAHYPRGHRRRGPDYALELATQPDRDQGGPGDCRGLHHGAQAQRDCATQRHYLCGDRARGRRAGRVSSTWSTATA